MQSALLCLGMSLLGQHPKLTVNGAATHRFITVSHGYRIKGALLLSVHV